jgi:hypothetical protein
LSLVVANNQTKAVRALVEGRLSGATLEDDSAGALIYRVPAAGDAVNDLASFVRTLEEYAAKYNMAEQKEDAAVLSTRKCRSNRAHNMKVSPRSNLVFFFFNSPGLFKEWGISLTSLEEVFLRLVRQADVEEKEKTKKWKKD